MTRASRASGVSKYAWNLPHYEEVLPNGLRVIVIPRRNAHRVAATMLFRVGSRFETAETNGISHFLEHMLYRGSPSLNHLRTR